MDSILQEKEDLENEIDSMSQNDHKQLAKRDSVAKFSEQSLNITNSLRE